MDAVKAMYILFNRLQIRLSLVCSAKQLPPGRGSHPHRSKMQPMFKSLVLQDFFGFLGLFFDPLFFATISDPYGLEPATFSNICN